MAARQPAITQQRIIIPLLLVDATLRVLPSAKHEIYIDRQTGAEKEEILMWLVNPASAVHGS